MKIYVILNQFGWQFARFFSSRESARAAFKKDKDKLKDFSDRSPPGYGTNKKVFVEDTEDTFEYYNASRDTPDRWQIKEIEVLP